MKKKEGDWMVEKKQIILFSSFLCLRNKELQVDFSLFTPSSTIFHFSFFFDGGGVWVVL